MVLPTSPVLIQRFATALYGVQLGSTALNAVMVDNGGASVANLPAIMNFYYGLSFSARTDAQMAATLVANVGITAAAGFTAAQVAEAEAFVVARIADKGANKGAEANLILNDFANMTAEPVFGAAAAAYNATIASAVEYARTNAADAPVGTVVTTFTLTTGRDMLTGTAGNDMFMADLSANASTFQSGDVLNGGNGTDTLMVTLVDTPFAVSATTNSVEIMHVRSQNSQAESDGDNNASGYTLTQNGHNKIVTADDNTIDAQNMTGMTQFWSTDSRADLVIEDVRNNSHETTIGFRNADAGDVDYAVFFNSQHITAPAGNTNGSQLFIQLLDLNAMRDGTGSLTNNPYNGVTITVDGTPLRIAGPTAFQTTYDDMVTGLNAALDAAGYPNIRAALGDAFSAINSTNGVAYQGTTVVLTNTGPEVIASTGFVTPDGTLPSNTNIHTLVTNTPATTIPSLTQTNILLDNVGRSSMSGDMMIGNMSTGDSGSKGIEQFNVTVDRSSWIKSLNTTNNSLEVVNVVNTGANGNLRIDDNSLTNDYYGLTDVRVLDASTMTGSVTASAVLGQAVTAKFMNLRDTAANPAADNSDIAYRNVVDTQFSYDLGAGNDSLTLDLSAANLAAAGTMTREDFVLEVNGGAGNDTIHTRIVNEGTQTLAANNASNWYANHKINANITVNAGEGNNTIRTEGAGDMTITSGAGNDTIYSDNAGRQVVTANTNTVAVPQVTTLTVNTTGTLDATDVFSVVVAGVRYESNTLAGLAGQIDGGLLSATSAGNVITITGAANGAAFTVSDFLFQNASATAQVTKLTPAAGFLNDLTVDINGNTYIGATLTDLATAINTNKAILGISSVVLNGNDIVLTGAADGSAFTVANFAGDDTPGAGGTSTSGTTTTINGVQVVNNTASASIATTTTGAAATSVGQTVPAYNDGKATWVVNATNADINNLASAESIAPQFLVDGRLTVVLSESVTGGAANNTNGFEVTVAIPTGTNYAVTSLHINQAIKDAINNNAVLNKLLVAQDGPSQTLVIRSLIDGGFVADDLSIQVASNYTAGVNTVFDAQVLTAARSFLRDSTADANDVTTLTGNALTAIRGIDGISADNTVANNNSKLAQLSGTDLTGVASTFASDNVINAGAGNDVIVLSTTVGGDAAASSNETIVFNGSFGTNTIVNFAVAGFGEDTLNFTSYLNNMVSASGSTASEQRKATSLVNAVDVVANSVFVTDFAAVSAIDGNANNTFANITNAEVLTALNANGVFATNNTANLVGTTGKAVMMMQDGTKGVYKLYEVTFTNPAVAGNDPDNFTAATLVGTVDFGSSLNFVGGNFA